MAVLSTACYCQDKRREYKEHRWSSPRMGVKSWMRSRVLNYAWLHTPLPFTRPGPFLRATSRMAIPTVANSQQDEDNEQTSMPTSAPRKPTYFSASQIRTMHSSVKSNPCIEDDCLVLVPCPRVSYKVIHTKLTKNNCPTWMITLRLIPRDLYHSLKFMNEWGTKRSALPVYFGLVVPIRLSFSVHTESTVQQ